MRSTGSRTWCTSCAIAPRVSQTRETTPRHRCKKINTSHTHTHTHTHRQRTAPPTHTHTTRTAPQPPNEHPPQTLNNARRCDLMLVWRNGVPNKNLHTSYSHNILLYSTGLRARCTSCAPAHQTRETTPRHRCKKINTSHTHRQITTPPTHTHTHTTRTAPQTLKRTPPTNTQQCSKVRSYVRMA